MKIKLVALLTILAITFSSCGDGKKEEKKGIKLPTKKEVKETPKKVEKSSKIDLMAPTLDNKGVGNIKSVKIDDKIDDKLVAKGKDLFKANCTACHKFKKRFVGPALKGVTQRRSPEWIMNMIMDPEKMVAEDPVAKALITEYNAPMANQSLKEDQARAILEYFRTKN